MPVFCQSDAAMAKAQCRQLTAHAIKHGEIIAATSCEHCGAPSPQAHHRDYRNYRDIAWLCRDCHMAEHARLREAGIVVPFGSYNPGGRKVTRLVRLRVYLPKATAKRETERARAAAMEIDRSLSSFIRMAMREHANRILGVSA